MRELLFVFQDVEDPRRGNAKRYDLHEMLALALAAMLAGGRTCVDMEDFGREREEWLRRFLALAHGIPSHDTFPRLFRKLDPAGPRKALLRLAQDWADESATWWRWMARRCGGRSRRPRSGRRRTCRRRSRRRRS